MSIVIDEGVVFETVWSGSDGWLDDKRGEFPKRLLNRVDYVDGIPPRLEDWSERKLPQVSVPAHKIRLHLLKMLDTQPRWESTELRHASGLTRDQFWNGIRDLKRCGYLEHPQKGFVALRDGVRKPVAA